MTISQQFAKIAEDQQRARDAKPPSMGIRRISDLPDDMRAVVERAIADAQASEGSPQDIGEGDFMPATPVRHVPVRLDHAGDMWADFAGAGMWHRIASTPEWAPVLDDAGLAIGTAEGPLLLVVGLAGKPDPFADFLPWSGRDDDVRWTASEAYRDR